MVNWSSPAETSKDVASISRLEGTTFPESAQQKLDEIGRSPINLHRALGHTPEMLSPLLDLIHAARFDAHTPRHERELMIVRIGQLEKSEYELAHHLPMARDAGLTEEQLDNLGQWRTSAIFDDRMKAILELADNLGQGDDLDAAFVDGNLSAAEQAELAMVGSTYIMIARIARAFDIEIDEYLRS